MRDSDYTPEEVARILRRPEHHAYLAWHAQEPVGFCSCLETPVENGVRLEVDLLGVMAEHRCRGLATALIAESMGRARSAGIRRFRAVVAKENVPSRRAFRRAGFETARPVEMIVYQVRGTQPHAFLPSDHRWYVHERGVLRAGDGAVAFCASGASRSVYRLTDHSVTVALAKGLRVQTVAYRGLWIERLWAASEQARAIMGRGVAEEAKRFALDEAGYLMPRPCSGPACCRQQQVISLVRVGYRSVGAYLLLETRIP